MATIFIFDLIITIDKNLYVIYNIFHNQGVFIMSNENQKDNNKVSIMPFIILFLISIVIFAIMYFLHSKNIENRFNRTLQNYEKSINLIFENAITDNGSNENIHSAKEDLKLSFEVGFKTLESSMNEIMKNSNDILQFWFAFLSVIMIVFTIIGFFLNNNILENAKKQLEMVEKEARTSRENIEKETKKLIEENNKNIQEYNLFNLGIQSINSKDYKLAIYYFNEVIKLNVNNVEAHYNKGLAKHYLADNEKGNKEEYNKFINEAIEDYNKAIELNPNYSIAFYNRGLAKYYLSNTKKESREEYNKIVNEALEDYNKAIELNPNYAEAYNNRGNAKIKLQKLEEAIEDYNEAIRLNPNYSTAFYNRGLAKLQLVKIEEAIKDFIKAYELNNNNEIKEKAKSQLISLAKENYEEAIKFCEEHNIDYKNKN